MKSKHLSDVTETATAEPIAPRSGADMQGASEQPCATGPLPLLEVPIEYYVVEGEHGRGGIGVVMRARDRRTDRVVALKQLQSLSPEARQRFEREMRITARLQHPGVVPVHETGRFASGEPFYAMKLVQGRSLKEVIAEKKTLDDRLSLLPHVLAVAETLAYAHSQRIIHRDLKPSNVIVGAYGETVVIDWGLAKDLDEDSARGDVGGGPYRITAEDGLTIAGQIVGTPAYMPPEQARGAMVDERADVYSIGAIIYHLFSGRPPYLGGTSAEVLASLSQGPPTPIVQLEPSIPADLVAIVETALSRDPAKRYPSAALLAADLRRFQAGQLVAAYQYSRSALLRRWINQHRAAVLATAITVVAITVTASASFSRVVDERDQAKRAMRIAESERARATRERNNVIITHAKESLSTDPTASIAWLKELPSQNKSSENVAHIALEAASRGVASRVMDLSTPVTTVLLSGTQDLLVIGTQGGNYQFYSWPTLKAIGHTRASDSGMVQIGHDSAVVALPMSNGQIKLWRPSKPESLIEGHTSLAWVSALSQDGNHLYTSGLDGLVRESTLSTGESRTLYDQRHTVRALAISSGHQLLATGSDDGRIILRNMLSGDKRVLRPHRRVAEGQGIHDLEFLHDGRLLCADAAGYVSIFTPKGVLAWQRHMHDGPSDHFRVARDSRYAISFGEHSIHRIDTNTLETELIGSHHAIISNSFLFDDGETDILLSASVDGTIRVWDLLRRTSMPLKGHRQLVSDMTVAKDSQGRVTAITASNDGQLRMWPIYRPISRSTYSHRSRVLEIKTSPDGKRFATSGQDGRILLVEPNGKYTELLGHSALVYGLWFSPDGTELASLSWDGVVRVWDVATGKALSHHSMPGSVNALAFGSGSEIFLAANTNIYVWDHASGASGAMVPAKHWPEAHPPILNPIPGMTRLVSIRTAQGNAYRGPWKIPFEPSIATVSPDAQVAYFFDATGRGVALNAASGTLTEMYSVSGPARRARALHGRRVVRLLGSGALELWDFQQQKILPILEHESTAWDFAVSTGTGDIATATIDGRVWLWNGSLLEKRWRELAEVQIDSLTDWRVNIESP